MTTWSQVIGRSDPIDGVPEEFETVAAHFGELEHLVGDLHDSLNGVNHLAGGEFAGEAAEAFREKVRGIDQALVDVPHVCRTLATYLEQHEGKLRELQRSADRALARAVTHWRNEASADSELDDARSRVSFVERQLAELRNEPEPDEGSISWWEGECDLAETRVWQAHRDLGDARAGLDAARADWDRLRGSEETLDEDTGRRLRDIELWSMADPSNVGKIKEAVADFVGFVVDLGQYVFSQEFLEDLFAILDELLVVLALVEMGCWLLSLIPVLTPVFGPIAAGLRVVNLVLGGIKLGIGAMLIGLGSEKVNLGSLLVEGVLLAGGALLSKVKWHDHIKGLHGMTLQEKGTLWRGIKFLDNLGQGKDFASVIDIAGYVDAGAKTLRDGDPRGPKNPFDISSTGDMLDWRGPPLGTTSVLRPPSGSTAILAPTGW